ncbi:DMT family transporter [Methylobrevis pamukkalensis]|uniref:EamA-like transporter family protein n=1 Tax=Methylobrevis pamukkalensis TaxID=1439726 RepID=A0A1E3H375_9HYPH|nr:DMT family transporter [Methylobrevis pamukkalensis]ODN70778.1 EamA-like transporter family protein [Methylobrevis pamukkalensis]
MTLILQSSADGPAPGDPAAVARAREADGRMRMRQRLAGIGLMALTMLMFATLDMSAKLAASHLPTLEVIWFRYAVHFALVVVLLNPVRAPGAWRMNNPRLQVLRALMLTANTSLNFIALGYLQLTQTVSIMFLSPLLIAMLSALFLKEHVGPRRWAAIFTGFVGVLVVSRPGFGDFHWAMLVSLGSVTCYALYVLLTRHLGQSETPGSLILVSAAVPTLLLAPLLPAVWVWPSDPLTILLLVGLGVLGGGGHYLLILAHRKVAASVLAPVTYTQIVWMVSLGYFVFGDVPDLWTLIGAGIVIASGLYLLQRERIRTPHDAGRSFGT